MPRAALELGITWGSVPFPGLWGLESCPRSPWAPRQDALLLVTIAVTKLRTIFRRNFPRHNHTFSNDFWMLLHLWTSLWYTLRVSRSDRINKQHIILSITLKTNKQQQQKRKKKKAKSRTQMSGTKGGEGAGRGRGAAAAARGGRQMARADRNPPGCSLDFQPGIFARWQVIYLNNEFFWERVVFLCYAFVFPSNLIYYNNVMLF